ncbi:MAG: TIGR03960 family B12-binding radical SAM protein [Deltaproteobacteria bacterium]|nr:TIGR03960 family B12-binding radical SAM protein [Deltaproteobacteria bacterium]
MSSHPYAGFVHLVEKPARYLGGEFNSVVKPFGGAATRFALCFPDVYDIGMSHLGTKILYRVINQEPDLLMERCFCPWLDMEKQLRERNLPLLSLENARPLRDFDVVGFSLQYEMTFTNVLTMLDLGRVPLRSEDRSEDDPLVIAGGPTATHAEPMAPFIDAFLIGDAEERLPRLLRHVAELRKKRLSRTETLVALAKEGGLYCPALYDREICERSGLQYVSRARHPGVPERVSRAFVDDLDRYPFPDDSPVPVAEAIFDRMSVEIARGCTEGCRFCQAGMIYRPVRERDPEQVVETLVSAIEKGGYDEAAITSLSTADYSCISPLVKRVMERLRPMKVSLGISSLRAYGLGEDLLDEIATVKATGLTFAPEAGTQRMRDVINKNVSEADLERTCHNVFSRGWNKMKLYFILGLPTETDEDVLGIADLGHKARLIGKRYVRDAQVTASTSSHVPKPHTPFQWVHMDSIEELRRKQTMLRAEGKRLGIKVKTHPVEVSYLEGIMSRGDFRVGWLVEEAWRRGARFDSWDDQLQFEAWEGALADFERKFEISREVYLGTLPTDGHLPWDHIDVGLDDGFLLREYRRALDGRLSPPCGKPAGAQIHATHLEQATHDHRKLVCYNCGIACDLDHMRDERLVFLGKLGAVEAPVQKERSERGEALLRIEKGLTPHDFKQGVAARYRIRFKKLPPFSLEGHLDLVRTLPQILRRAKVRTYYSEGFSPKPVMSFGPALPLGARSLAEYAELKLLEDMPPRQLMKLIRSASPMGFDVDGCVKLETGAPGLAQIIDTLELFAEVSDSALIGKVGSTSLADVDGRVQAAFEARLEVEVERKNKSRTLVLNDVVTSVQAELAAPALGDLAVERLGVRFTLKAGSGPSLRPVEVVRALLGVEIEPTAVTRLGCWRLVDGIRIEPLNVGAETPKSLMRALAVVEA